MKAKGRTTALFEFNSTGGLKAIYLNAQNKHDQEILQRGLYHLLRPEKMGLVRRLFGMVTNGK